MSQNPRYRLRTKIEAVGSHVMLSGKAPQDASGLWAISTMNFFDFANLWNRRHGCWRVVGTAGTWEEKFVCVSLISEQAHAYVCLHGEHSQSKSDYVDMGNHSDLWLFLFPIRLCDWRARFHDWTEKEEGRGAVENFSLADNQSTSFFN